MGRKTAKLSYNLHDRGRKFNGVDRSNVDFNAMINLINSSQVQELAQTGSLYGYYGHSVRQRFGMRPPETVVVDGKTIHLEPAFKTLEIHAHKDGRVEHVNEFLENDAGEYALRQYKSKAGGFSTAVNYKSNGSRLMPVGFFGFDYVLQPNYSNNVGDGKLYDDIGLLLPVDIESDVIACFDSLTDVDSLTTERRIIATMLERDIVTLYDSIREKNELYERNEQALAVIAKSENRKKLIESRQKDYFQGLSGEISSFDSIIDEAKRKAELVKIKTESKSKLEPIRNFFG